MEDNTLVQALRQLLQQELDPLKDEVRRMALMQENTILPQLQLIYENQTQLIDEHKTMQKMERKIEVLQDEVSAIKEAIKELKHA